VALIRVATSLIRPVRLPVIPVNKESGDYLKYLVFVVREGRKIGLKYPISLLFSLLPASGPLGDRFSETASATIFYKWFQLVKGRPLPLPPLVDLEQNLKDASEMGEISGSRFAIRSAPSGGCLERSAPIASATARTLMTSDEMQGTRSEVRLAKFVCVTEPLFGHKGSAAVEATVSKRLK
jgi:hypothetical protein